MALSPSRTKASILTLAFVLHLLVVLPSAIRPVQAINETIYWNSDKEFSSDFTVLVNQTLIINNGADVNFTGDYRFIVYGCLQVNGTDAAETVFRSKGVPRWGGIELNNTAAPSRLTHAQVLDARYGVYVLASTAIIEISLIKGSEMDGIHANYADIVVKYSTFNENGAGPTSQSAIYLDNSKADIHDNTISHNNNGIFMKGAQVVTVANNKIWFQDGEGGNGVVAREKSIPTIQYNNISNNRVAGIVLNDTSSTVTNNTITYNGDDGMLAVNLDRSLIADNIIQNNGDDGIDSNTAATVEIARNVIKANVDTGLVVHGSKPKMHDNTVAGNDQGLSVSVSGMLSSKRDVFDHNDYGINIFESGVAIIESCVISNSTSFGVFIERGNGTFDACYLLNNSYHFRLLNTTMVVVNSTIWGASRADTNLTDASALFYNTSISWTPDPFTINTGNFWNLSTANYLNVLVRSSKGTPVQDVKINARSPLGAEFNYTTGPDGRSTWNVLVEKVMIHGPLNNYTLEYNPWKINVTKGGASNETKVVMNTTVFLEMVLDIANLPPTLKDPLPDLEVDEDVNAPKYLDLDTKFEDFEPLTYTVVLADQDKVKLVVEDGHFLSAYPVKDWNGRVQCKVRATDPSGLSVESNVFNITVRPINDPPQLIPIPALTLPVGQPFTYNVNATDVDNNESELTFSDDSDMFDIDPHTGIITFTPNASALGLHMVTIKVSDGLGTATQVVPIEIIPAANAPPMITSTPPDRVKAGQRYLYDVKASDPEGVTVTISLRTGPPGMTISNGTLKWDTTIADVGQVTVDVAVSDGVNLVSQQFDITVWYDQANNSRPILTVRSPVDKAVYNGPFQMDALATDPDGDTIIVKWYSDGNLIFTGTQGTANLSVGGHQIRVTASDASETVEVNMNITIETGGTGPGPDDMPDITLPKSLLNEPMCIAGLVALAIIGISLILYLHRYATSGERAYRRRPGTGPRTRPRAVPVEEQDEFENGNDPLEDWALGQDDEASYPRQPQGKGGARVPGAPRARSPPQAGYSRGRP